MPAASDWRSAHTADMLMRLDQEQFAVEFPGETPPMAKITAIRRIASPPDRCRMMRAWRALRAVGG